MYLLVLGGVGVDLWLEFCVSVVWFCQFVVEVMCGKGGVIEGGEFVEVLGDDVLLQVVGEELGEVGVVCQVVVDGQVVGDFQVVVYCLDYFGVVQYYVFEQGLVEVFVVGVGVYFQLYCVGVVVLVWVCEF